jgi:hypothetical protein
VVLVGQRVRVVLVVVMAKTLCFQVLPQQAVAGALVLIHALVVLEALEAAVVVRGVVLVVRGLLDKVLQVAQVHLVEYPMVQVAEAVLALLEFQV